MKTVVIVFLLMNFRVSFAEELIFWNVGQGHWATHITKDSCFHFDMGGERAPIQKIKNLCYGKKEILFLSHWDWDHQAFIIPYSRSQKICIVSPARVIKPATSKLRKKTLLRECTAEQKDKMYLLYEGDSSRSSNSASQVFYNSRMRTLFPGDSPSQQEKIWSLRIPNEARIFSLSHHGSKTSTSRMFLKNSKKLQQAVASSRFEKYGHPHREVVLRLKKNRIALLSTEDWGNIIFQKDIQ